MYFQCADVGSVNQLSPYHKNLHTMFSMVLPLQVPTLLRCLTLPPASVTSLFLTIFPASPAFHISA